MEREKRPPRPHHRKPRKDTDPRIGWRVDNIPDAQEGDQVTWTAPDETDMTIWFPPVPEWDPLRVGQETIKKGKSKSYTVPGKITGTFQYSIFCHDGKMAEGSNSPPEMIIV